jgi:hypothetical protein
MYNHSMTLYKIFIPYHKEQFHSSILLSALCQAHAPSTLVKRQVGSNPAERIGRICLCVLKETIIPQFLIINLYSKKTNGA